MSVIVISVRSMCLYSSEYYLTNLRSWNSDSARRRFKEKKREECEEERQAQVAEKGEDACNKLMGEKCSIKLIKVVTV